MEDAEKIDWECAWLNPYRVHCALSMPGEQSSEQWHQALNQDAQQRGLRTSSGHPIRFVGADDAGPCRRQRPSETGRIPTRPNLHDFFNAIVWLTFPETKATLNQIQASIIARDGISGRRGPVRDAATQIDESGLLLASTDPDVFAALAAHRWLELLVTQRARWGDVIVPVILGHGLLEQLTSPFKGLTAAVVPLLLGEPLPSEARSRIDVLDRSAADFLTRPDLQPRMLLRLPVLGIPGWCPANIDPTFYQDPVVFRPK